MIQPCRNACNTFEEIIINKIGTRFGKYCNLRTVYIGFENLPSAPDRQMPGYSDLDVCSATVNLRSQLTHEA